MARKHGGLGRGLDALIPMREEVEKAMSSAEFEGVEILFADDEDDLPAVEKKVSVPQTESVSRETISFKEDVKQEVIKENKEETPVAVKSSETNVDDLKEAVTVRISEVEPNRKQPRKTFDDEKLEELAESIKTFDGYTDKLMEVCLDLEKEMRSLLSHAEEGRILKDGIRTAIVGRPNVGKSSLLNHLAGEERAIVTDIAGTTRDTLSETVRVGGVLLHLTDTAGIRKTHDKVEQIGVDRAQKALDSADLILFVIDSSRALSAEDEEIAARIINKMEEGKKCILLMNKTDLSSGVKEEDVKALFTSKGAECPPLLFCSLQTGEGTKELGDFISEMFHTGEIAQKNEIFISNLRHKGAVQEALDSICLVEDSINNGMSEDFFSIDLMNAYRVLGTILGEAVEDDLVEEIFSKFCMGK